MNALKLTVYLGERDRAAGRLAAQTIGDLLADRGMRIAVLLRGAEGFGLRHRLMTTRLLTLSEDLPLVWVAVDRPARVRAVAGEIDDLLSRGLVTLERARLADGRDLAPEPGDGVKLTIYCDRRSAPAHVAIVDRLRAAGVEGASVLLGVDGVRCGVRRRARFLDGNGDVPLMILALGSAPRIRAALDDLADLAPRAETMLERIRVLKRDGAHVSAPTRPPATDGNGLDLWHKLMVVSAEGRQAAGGTLSVELVRRLREAGADGASVLRGIWGYAGDAAPGGDRMWELRRRVPMVAVTVHRPARMDAVWPVVDALTVRRGLVTSELVPAFRALGGGMRVGGLHLAEVD